MIQVYFELTNDLFLSLNLAAVSFEAPLQNVCKFILMCIWFTYSQNRKRVKIEYIAYSSETRL